MQMKNHQIVNTLVIACGVVALAGATLYAVVERQDSVTPKAETTQVSQDKTASVGVLIGGLEARLAANPDDAKGWILLARSHDHLGNNDRAWNAYSRARELGMADESLELKLATNMVSSIDH